MFVRIARVCVLATNVNDCRRWRCPTRFVRGRPPIDVRRKPNRYIISIFAAAAAAIIHAVVVGKHAEKKKDTKTKTKPNDVQLGEKKNK